MRIIGIDPGYDRLGIAIAEKDGGKDRLIYSDCFQTSPEGSIYERFLAIGTEIGRILDEFRPEAMAIETLFLTKNQKTAMRVAEARGIIVYEAAKRGLPVREYGPMEIKAAVTGNGRSDKAMVGKMVRILAGLGGGEKIDDELDAVAAALTGLAMAPSSGKKDYPQPRPVAKKPRP